MQDQTAQLLEQLRDIHTVAAPQPWPPAPGWWLLAALLLLALIWLGRQLARRLAVRRRRRAWLQTLEQIGTRLHSTEPVAGLAELNRLFRAVALRAFPDSRCAQLQGEEWVGFIQALLPEGSDPEAVAVLATGPYHPRPDIDAGPLLQAARQWVQRYG